MFHMLIKFYMKERNNFILVKSEQFLMYFILNPTISTLPRNDCFVVVVVVCLFWWLNFGFFSYCSRFLFNSHYHVSQILSFHLCTWHSCQYLRIISKLYYKGNIQWCDRVRFFGFWIENFSSLFSNITLMAWNQLQWEFHSMEIDCLCLCLIFLEGWMFNIYQHIPKSIAPSYGLYHIHVEGKEEF